MLPENHKRTDNRMYEEVEIPVSRNPPPPVGEKKIRIETLDKVNINIYLDLLFILIKKRKKKC